MKTIFTLILLAVFTFIFYGCGGGNEFIQLQLKCDDNTNDGNAVVITVYQLTNADKFRYASFESLTKNPDATLGEDLIINSKFERTVVPGETFDLNELELKKEATFLGVVADFHSPLADGWQQLISLEKGLDKLIINVHENSISSEIED